jgi:hypothetical protein
METVFKYIVPWHLVQIIIYTWLFLLLFLKLLELSLYHILIMSPKEHWKKQGVLVTVQYVVKIRLCFIANTFNHTFIQNIENL